MGILSVREYRNHLAASFDRAAEGERVLIRRKNTLYALVSIGEEDLILPESKQQHIDKIADSIRRSWNEVKRIEAGDMPTKSAMAFLDEL